MELSGYTYFWGGVFSQWHKATFKDALELKYNCCEQYMMCQKALLMNDNETYQKIRAEKNPRIQKSLGRQVANWDEKIWKKEMLQVVYHGNMMKYLQNKSERIELLATGNSLLVEASPLDLIWGIGLDAREAKLRHPENWPGKNYLGKTETLVREDILNGTFTDDVNAKFLELGWL